MSMKDLDPALLGAGQKAGIEIWRIENLHPVPVPQSSHGKFFTGDCYVILKTTALKSGTLRHDIHYWLGKDTSQDEAGTVAIKTVELDTALGGRAVQYRELQGHETEKFLSYFKPCIIPQKGGFSSGSKHAEAKEHQNHLYVCKGKHAVHVEEVPFARSSLNHDDIFIVDTRFKIFQFNGSNTSIQERARALEVVQYIKDTYHNGKCEIAAVEDGKLMADAAAGEFWSIFGGFAPLPRKVYNNQVKSIGVLPPKLLRIEKGQAVPVEANSLARQLLDSSKCYIIDCGMEVFVWVGKSTYLQERKTLSGTVHELLQSLNRSTSHVIRMIEGFETVMFKSKFDSWPQSTNVSQSADAKGKVAALLKRQGVNVRGLVKAEDPQEEEIQPHIDCTGDLQVWRVKDHQKTPLEGPNLSKFYSGDCYIFQYAYRGEDREEYLIGTWFGKQSVEEDRVAATSQACKMVELMKFFPAQARIHEGQEPIQFLAIFQTLIVFKGGLSDGYKRYIAKKGIPDDTYTEDGLALFRIQGTGPDNMQAIQVEPVSSSFNSSYCYIVHSGPSAYIWLGSSTTSEEQELAERWLDILQPEAQSRFQKEGAESAQFWELLGGKKSEYPKQKLTRVAEGDPHLFSCTLSNGGDLKVDEVYNFNQDDLMTEDIFILDCRSDIYVWIGQMVEPKPKTNGLNIGEKFLERDFLCENISKQTPIYIVTEMNEPGFFTRFFTWDSRKFAMHGNSFQRKMAIVKHGGVQMVDKPRRRVPLAMAGRSGSTEAPQRSRSLSVAPEGRRVRGRSPAFNALASAFENPNARNLSTPPPMVSKLYPKAAVGDTSSQRSATIAALTKGFEQPGAAKQFIFPRSIRGREFLKPIGEETNPETIQEDVKEGEADDDEGLTTYPYERLKTSSTDTPPDVDVTKRETYLSSEEFKAKFGMSKSAFYKLPKWKQNKLKTNVGLF